MARATYLLDSGLLIRHLRGRPEAVRIMRELGKREHLSIASVSRLEIHAGMHEHERYHTQKLLSRFITFPMDSDVAERAGDYIREFHSRGVTLAVPDAIIAATALVHGLTLVTFNPKDFPMSGLNLFPTSSTKNE
ncbi:MAG: type II toxin-antitoxin system VapC family toxin [Chloroflexi bacterium]|nr:type II toxin-antitoxin system VapC family toxin [Chloroflexota bacterium]